MRMRILLVAGYAALALPGMQTLAQVVNQAAATPTLQPATAPVPIGPTLDVIPHVSADGYTIQLNLLPTVTEFLGYDDPGEFRVTVGQQAAPIPLPKFRIRQVVTSSIVWDGQTVVLGGLISEAVAKRKDKVPVLGDLPIVGRLFRSEGMSSSKKNLVIFVTPTIVDPAGNRVHDEDNLPYDPNKMPPQSPNFVPPN